MQRPVIHRGNHPWPAGVLTALSAILLTACTTPAERIESVVVVPAPTVTEEVPSECVDYLPYAVASPATVTILTELAANERQLLTESWTEFEACTGIRIVLEGSEDVAEETLNRLAERDFPDLMIVPDQQLLKALASRGVLVPAPPKTIAHVRQFWAPIWEGYGTIEGTLYASPFSAHVDSLVWYSPKQFAAWQVEVPSTWDEMLDLSDALVSTGTKPWCGGLANEPVAGAPAAAWLSELMLRLYGAVVYDRWTNHELTFGSPQVLGAMEVLEYWLRNPDYVNGGLGDVESIATTPAELVVQAVLKGECAMMQQDSGALSTGTLLDAHAVMSPDGDIYAFALPGMGQESGSPVLGSGDFIAAFADRTEVAQVRDYLSSERFANARAALGGWVSANSAVGVSSYPTTIEQRIAQLLTQPDVIFRLNGADAMPLAVGRGAFPESMNAWFAGTQSTQEVLANIDAAWPPGPDAATLNSPPS